MRTCIFPIFVFLMISWVLPGSTAGQTLCRVEISPPSTTQVAGYLSQRGFDVLPLNGHGRLELIVSPSEMTALAGLGFSPRILEVGSPLQQPLPEGFMPPPGYPDLAQIMADMSAAEAAHPDICQVVNLTTTYGTPPTVEGRDIFAVKISDNVTLDEDEPRVLHVSNHHAREVITPLIALDIIERLTTGHGIDPDITAIVDNNETWIIPVMNPDGYEYVFTTDNLWRKNRRIFPEGDGVDLNRNYPFGWDGPCGGSTNVNSQTYRGPAATSEAEVQTLIALSDDRLFCKVQDFHSHAQEVRVGYGCWSHPWDAFLIQEATVLANAAGYVVSSSCCLGGDIHYQMSGHGALSFLYETGTEFQPEITVAQAEVVTLWPSILAFMQRAPTFTGQITDAATGSPLEASLDFLDVDFERGEVLRSNAAFGRYGSIVPPGTYTVRYAAPGHVAQVHNVVIPATGELTLDVALQTAAPTTGQPNSADASFLVEGSTDQSGAAPGTQNGPYYSWRVPGDLLSLQFAGNVNEDFLLLLGPLNANNAVFSTTGSLDLGQLGGINSFSDVTIALNGISPVTFLDGLAHLGPGGSQLLVFTLPPSMSGMVFGLQSIITRPGGTALFTAATEVVIL